MRARPLITNPRILAITLLGFSSGLPLALTSSTLQAWFTQSGIKLATIGALTLVGFPYLFKFMWAPMMDRIVPPLWGRRRGWIGIAQLGLCITLFILAAMNPKIEPGLMGMMALFIAFISASQDIAIDAYRTDSFLPEERGMGSAWFIFSARMAILVGSALALVIADYWGWRLTYELMGALMALSIIVTWLAPTPPDHFKPAKNFIAAITDPFRDLLKRDGIWLIFLFIVLYKIGDALALSLISTFLLRFLHFTLTEVGFASKTIGLIASILGAFLGGYLLRKMGLYRSLLYFGFLQAFSNLMYMLLAVTGKSYILMMAAMFVEYFCNGMSTTALVVFLTALCHQQYSATQYATLSALFAIGRVGSGPVAAYIVEQIGWAGFYGCTVLVCFPGLILLTILRRKVTFHAEAIA